MKIIVCAKQVPDTNEVRINPKTGTLIREGVPSILNPDDASALEAALRIKDQRPDTQVTVLSMGPPQAKAMLQQCLAMGADEAVLLSDRALGGSDTWATSNALAAAVKKLGGCDILFAGQQAIDGDTAQVGPQLAEKLGIPQVTYARSILAGGGGTLTVQRALEDGYMLLEVKTPCLITAIKELNKPRYMSVRGIYRAVGREICVWSAADIGIGADKVGLEASPTNVFRSFTPAPRGAGVAVPGDTPRELAANLLSGMRARQIIA